MTQPFQPPAAPSKAPLPEDHPAAVQLLEDEFLGYWWHAAIDGKDAALDIRNYVPPEVLQGELHRDVYAMLSDKLAKGEAVYDAQVLLQLYHLAKGHGKGHERLAEIERFSTYGVQEPEHLRAYARRLVKLYRGRTQHDLLVGAAQLTREALASGKSVKRIADELLDRLLHLHSRAGEEHGPQTQQEIVTHLLTKLDNEKPNGIEWPWPLVQEALGIIPPGAVVGLSAYSGNGKTLFTANLFRELVLRGVPVIVFSTEMLLQFLERVVATMARVRKEFAEEGDWRKATKADMRRYRQAMRGLVGLYWDVVQQASISPEEIVIRVRTLRRKYRGMQVLVIVDHMHRLLYPRGVSADEERGAPAATRLFKNHAVSDTEGGLSYLLLFQPSKPEDEAKVFAPVPPTRIRGHSGGWNELDTYISCFRRLVEVTRLAHTPWGTPAAVYDTQDARMPKRGKFGDPNTKPDDEHFYLTMFKHRIRGSLMETLMLPIHGPSGFIYETDYLAGVDQPQPGDEDEDTDGAGHPAG